ncbi:MAG: YeeE/YedE family protein [Pseudomonadota bacterium]
MPRYAYERQLVQTKAIQSRAFSVAVAVLVTLTLIAWQQVGFRHALSVIIGGVAGVALYHAAFGFTSAWRRLQVDRRGTGFRAQILLIGISCAVSLPLLAHGSLFGSPVYGNVLPIGIASAFGALLFGIGMQFGGGCASGTLFTVGGGSTRMLLVLIAFIVGSLWATWDIPQIWATLPRYGGVSLLREFGLTGSLLTMFGLLTTLWFLSIRLELRRHGSLEQARKTSNWLRGPWSAWDGAIALAIVSVTTLIVTHRPWGVTAGFALWGAQAADASGIFNVALWPYWENPQWRAAQLQAGPFANFTSLMNFAIIAGAMAAAAAAGRFTPTLRLTQRDVVTAVIGGLAMGYGARLAYGCNIGAYLGGLVSGSLHGWWWLVFGFTGSVVGNHLRRLFEPHP